MPRETPSSSRKEDYTLANRYTFRINLVSTLIARMTELSIGQQLDLSVPQWRILLYLHSFGQGGVREIARFHHYTDSQVSRGVQELVSRGLLERLEAENDRRVAAVQLTALGSEVVEQGLPAAVERNRQLVSAIAPSDRAAFERALAAITKEAQSILADMQAQEMAAYKKAIEGTAIDRPARKRQVSTQGKK